MQFLSLDSVVFKEPDLKINTSMNLDIEEMA